MSEPIALLVGGTKVLERELQNHLQMPLLSVATIEDAAKIIQERQTKLIVLGPTLRRALATVTTLRREGQTEPRLMVVYRDDQRDEVKRHQKGRQVADSYIVQSRIQKEVGPAIGNLLGLSGETSLEEIPAEALSVEEDHLAADEGLQPPPTGTTGPNDVLGSYDDAARRAEQLQTETLEADALELLEELPMMEDELLEELDDGELSMEEMTLDEIALDDMTLQELPALSEELDGRAGDSDLLASDLLEDMVEDLDGEVEELPLDSADLEISDEPEVSVQPLVAGAETVDSAEMDTVDLEASELEAVEIDGTDLESAELDSAELDSAELDSAELDSLEPVEEVVTADLIDEVSASAEPIEDLELAELIEDMESEPVVAAAAAPEPAAVQAPEPVVEAPAPAAAAWVAPVVAVAAAAEPVAAVVAPVAEPPPNVSRRQPSGAQAMFSELTSFVERLQDSAASIARLEAENEKLREDLELAKHAAQPEREAELLTLRQNLSDLQLRLTGAEQSRDAAVEARMRTDLAGASHAEELAKLRQELGAARQELAALSQQCSNLNQQLAGQEQAMAGLRGELASAQAHVATLESQLDARRRISADSAKSLRSIAAMLEG